MIYISDAIIALGISEWELRGEPTNESEFNSMFRKADGSGGWSSNTSDFGVTWTQVKTKYDELVTAEPLNEVRAERNKLLEQSDWVVIKEREEGGSVSNFADWKEYRQKLRDITNTYKSLEDVKWPTAPSE
tara:strand:+ start:15 stop:407 length:393 start_codon:yes stop_codon:yes gene_type:complete